MEIHGAFLFFFEKEISLFLYVRVLQNKREKTRNNPNQPANQSHPHQD